MQTLQRKDSHLSRTVPFFSAVADATGGQRKIQNRDYLSEGELPIIDQGATLVAGYTNDQSSAFKDELPVILFGDHTRVFKYVDFPFALGADGVKVLSPKDSFVAKYLYYYFLSIEVPSRGYSRHFKLLKETVVPWVPPSEQHRIVEILDQADRLRKLRAEADRKTERILPALFIKMFGDPVRNPKGWSVEILGKLGDLDRGKSRHRPRNDPRLLGGPYPFIQTGDVANSGGYIRSYTSTYSEFGLAQSRLWPAGTLCITIAANIAATGILGFDACFPDSVVGFTPGPRTNSAYVRVLLEFLKPMLERSAPQMAQKNINLEILRNLSVPVPDVKLQKEFLRHHDEFMRINLSRRGSDEKIERTWQTLIHRAFCGELTAKWRESHMKELLSETEHQAKALHG